MQAWHHSHLAFTLADLGSVVCARGEADRARLYFEEALRLFEAAGSDEDLVAGIEEELAACAGRLSAWYWLRDPLGIRSEAPVST